jgi:hypothetical protein
MTGMLILGVVCLILGFILGIQLLWIIGIVLAAVGALLLILTAVSGTQIGGRRYWY